MLKQKKTDVGNASKNNDQRHSSVNVGIFSDMVGMDAMIYGSNLDEDAELEAELMALQQSSPNKSTKGADASAITPSSSMQAIKSLDSMIANSLRDDYSDDDDISHGEELELLSELQELNKNPSPVESPAELVTTDYKALLNERLDNYEQAKVIAEINKETSKVKRLDRGINTVRDLLRKQYCGAKIDESAIPPPVAKGTINKSAQNPILAGADKTPSYHEGIRTASSSVMASNVPPADQDPYVSHPTVEVKSPSVPLKTTCTKSSVPSNLNPQDVETYQTLLNRRDQYRESAKDAKKISDLKLATKHLKIAKSFDLVIQALVEGKPIDLSNMPPPLMSTGKSTMTNISASDSNKSEPEKKMAAKTEDDAQPSNLSPEAKCKLFQAPERAGSVLEALEQRLEKYKTSAQEASTQGNSSKARRMNRITKQFESAIKDHKAGKPVDFSDLPTPPGFPPITAASCTSPQGHASTDSSSTASSSPLKTPSPALSPPAASSPLPQNTIGVAGPPPEKERKVSPRSQMQRQSSALSRTEQNAAFLQDRQSQYKKAAIEAKKNGDVELAKKYLRMAKGFDQMVIAAQSGYPVNMAQVPPPPGGETDQTFDDFVCVDAPPNTALGDRNESYEKLRKDLVEQVKMCCNNAEHFTKLGDVMSASKFDKLMLGTRKDLDSLENAYKHGDPVPRFHYDNKTFSLVKSFTELGDNALEMCIIRGINYALPSGFSANDMDTYIKYDFPFPADEPQKGVIDVVKGTNSPEYNKTVLFEVKRKSRSFLRFLKNKGIKLDLYYKRGLFKSDKLLGSVFVKVICLETVCEFHDTYDIMDGRKAAGGKVEVRLRTRDPFGGKQVDQVTEKWLVIDHFERNITNKAKAAAAAPPVKKEKVPAPQVASIEVMKYEKQLLDKQIKLNRSLSKGQMQALTTQAGLLTQRIEQQKLQNSKGEKALSEYACNIKKLQQTYLEDAQGLVKQGNREKAQRQLNKKKLIETEIEQINLKLSVKKESTI